MVKKTCKPIIYYFKKQQETQLIYQVNNPGKKKMDLKRSNNFTCENVLSRNLNEYNKVDK